MAEAPTTARPVAAGATAAASPRRVLLGPLAQRYGAAAVLVVLVVYNALFTPYFLSLQSILDVQLRQAAPIAIVALGMALVIGTGGIDLSVGSVMAISGQVGALLLAGGGGPAAAVVAGVLVAAACGVFNGTLVARYGVQPIIATLILFVAGRGIAQILTGGKLQDITNVSFQFLGLGHVAALPFQVVVMIVIAAVVWFLVARTAFGRYVLAIGGNERAARLVGIPVGRVKLATYVLCSALAGFVGLIVIAFSSASDANNVGLGMELDAIAAVAVAGAPLTGGRVSAVGTVIGAIMLRLLQNTLIAHGATREVAQMVEGVVIVVALWVQRHTA